MYYQENLRKAREYLNKRQKQIDHLTRKPIQAQGVNIRQIFAILRSKDRNEKSESRQLKTIYQDKKEDNIGVPLIVITSQNPDQRDSNHSITAKLIRLNKITRNKTEITPTQYNFIDRIVEPTIKKPEIHSEQISPLRMRKNAPSNLTDRRQLILKNKETIHQKGYHVQNQKSQGCIITHQFIHSEQTSPSFRRLNQTSYQCDKTKIFNKIKNQPLENEIKLIRQISGWTIQSQESIQTPK
ncbi:unnamed protein product [Paramecium primaurelia]|uniref:Uncharacterized protein n=1 Tax=Paramecium primaurelia TaxID=5886 RepID=A0A8S1KGN3_PARPR|nr:unnamed protein product [Paramecium primaurelia]